MYLPPYSIEPNLIEQFWSILKCKAKQIKFSDVKMLSSRMIEASEAVSLEHLRNFAQHYVNQFKRCLNKCPMWMYCYISITHDQIKLFS